MPVEDEHMEEIRARVDGVCAIVDQHTVQLRELGVADTVIREDIARLSSCVADVREAQASSSATLLGVAENVGHIRAKIDQPGVVRLVADRLTGDRVIATAALAVVLVLGVLALAIWAGLDVDTITASGWGAEVSARGSGG